MKIPVVRIIMLMGLGLLVGLSILQEDPWFKQVVAQKLNENIGASLECLFSSTITHINVVAGTLELTTITAQPTQGNDWQWSCKRASVTFSWLSYMLQGHLNICMHAYDGEARSSMTQTTLAIADHLKIMMETPAIKPFLVKTVTIKNGHFTVHDAYNNTFTSTLQAHIDCLPTTVATLIFNKGTLLYNNKKIIEDCLSTITITPSITFNSAFKSSLLPGSPQLHINGQWDPQKGLVARLVDETTMVNAQLAIDQHNTITLQGSLAGTLWLPQAPTLHIQGQGHCLDDLRINGTLTLEKEQTSWAQGTWSYHHQHIDYVATSLVDIPVFKNWLLPANELTVQGTINKTCPFKLHGNGCVRETITEKNYDITADIEANNDTLSCSLHHADRTIKSTIKNNPQWYVEQLTIYQKDQQQAQVTGTDQKFLADINYTLIKDCLPLGYEFPGQGIFSIEGNYTSHGCTAQLTSKNLHIRIPSLYNTLESITATITADFIQHRCLLKNATIQLNKGSLKTSQCTCNYGNHGIEYIHAPFIFSHCFVNMGKDIFALLSGSGFATYTPQGPTLTGQIIIDRAHVRNNVLSSEFQRSFIQSTASLPLSHHDDNKISLQLITRRPINIQTPFLETAAQLRLLLTGSCYQPEVTGTIELLKGSLIFPYQPLFITSGTIQFVPHQPYDPLISLAARNTIKKYNIGITLHGSASNPIIQLESSPHLEKEQIIMLLLGGSEDGSLYLMMPPALSNSLESLIFGSSATATKIQKYAKSLLKPLKHVRFVPSFSDQTGRGGLRGAVAIDVNDRLHALIQQNFSLTEDIRLEVDYDLSDDTSIRALKDERGNVGAEVEMRWKL